MNVLFALLQLKKVLYPTVAVALLLGATVARAATGGSGLGPFSGTSAAPTATLSAGNTPAPATADTTASPSTNAFLSSGTPPSSSSGTSASPSNPGPTTDADSENFGGSGGTNQVKVVNRTDNTLKIRGRIQLNHIEGQDVSPQNLAYSYGSCRQCQTLAVALQINLFSTNATNVHPHNAAIALNYQCTGCTTVAKALQYNLSVADPNQTSRDVKGLVHAIKMKLHALNADRGITLSDAEAQVNAVINQFQALTQYLGTKRQQDTTTTNPDATPIASATPDTTPTADTGAPPTVTATPSAGTTDTPTPAAGTTDTATPRPDDTATATATATLAG